MTSTAQSYNSFSVLNIIHYTSGIFVRRGRRCGCAAVFSALVFLIVTTRLIRCPRTKNTVATSPGRLIWIVYLAILIHAGALSSRRNQLPPSQLPKTAGFDCFTSRVERVSARPTVRNVSLARSKMPRISSRARTARVYMFIGPCDVRVFLHREMVRHFSRECVSMASVTAR